MRRLTVLPVLAALLIAPFLVSGAALAHHGLMIWDAEKVVTVEGFISDELDLYPHWEFSVRTPDGQDWKIDVGDEFELRAAGLKATDLPIGTNVTIVGNPPSDDPDGHLLRPLRVIVGDTVYQFRAKD